jgi:DeoR/GlpR family transcriptional regulator of sugar metabolism
MAEDAFTTMNCDRAFIGVAGICVTPRLTEYNPDDARVKRIFVWRRGGRTRLYRA